MENNIHVGIYISKDAACVVVLQSSAHSYKVRESFGVSLEDAADTESTTIGYEISAQLRERGLEIRECNVALDATMFTQHNLYSDFDDARQVSATIESDVEEVMGVDISDYAVAFSLIGKQSTGSRVNVFATRKDLIEEIILDLTKHGLDPVTIEPDAICIGRCLYNDIVAHSSTSWAFCVFSQKVCYICVDTKKVNQPFVRALLYNESIDKLKLISRELSLTLASPGIDYAPETLFINECNGLEDLQKATSLDVKNISEFLSDGSSILSDQEDLAANAVACGAAMINFVKCPRIDFRKKFMPYQGRKKVVEFSLRLIGIAIAILFFSLAFNWSSSYRTSSNDTNVIKAQIKKEYSAAMKGRRMTSAPTKDLKSELNKLKRIKSGDSVGDDSTVPSRLRQILEAINKTPSGIGLKIKTISISNSHIRVDGSTSSRSNTQKLLAQLRRHKKLKVSQETLKQVGNEDSFMITLEPLH